MKLDSQITEERKVRCTGCRIVILLTPDPDEPDGMRVSIPKKSDKPKGMAESHKRVLLLAALGIMVLIVAVGLFLSLRGPPVYASVEGDVSLDNAPMEKGTIEFVTVGTPKEIKVQAGIVRGRYSVRAGIGKNKVSITGDEGVNVAPRFNKDTILEFEVVAGENRKSFDVASK